ncbi:MAG: hypothetical protein KC910_22575 [Candidatus Eremiobacteraeota bacterium]|nr:hypothetical protein [Candidatus Eremiobacteraeota bacterium]
MEKPVPETQLPARPLPLALRSTIDWILTDARELPGRYLWEATAPEGGE